MARHACPRSLFASTPVFLGRTDGSLRRLASTAAFSAAGLYLLGDGGGAEETGVGVQGGPRVRQNKEQRRRKAEWSRAKSGDGKDGGQGEKADVEKEMSDTGGTVEAEVGAGMPRSSGEDACDEEVKLRSGWLNPSPVSFLSSGEVFLLQSCAHVSA